MMYWAFEMLPYARRKRPMVSVHPNFLGIVDKIIRSKKRGGHSNSTKVKIKTGDVGLIPCKSIFYSGEWFRYDPELKTTLKFSFFLSRTVS